MTTRRPRPSAVLAAAVLATLASCQETGEGRSGWSFLQELSALDGESAPAAATVAWRHELGAELDVPADWEIVPDGATSSFVPAGERIDAENARAVCSFVFVEAPGARPMDSLASVEDAAGDVAVLAQFFEHAQDTEFLVLGDRPGVVLGFDTEDESGPGRVELYATVVGNRIVGLLAAGERDRVAAHRPEFRAMFQSLRFGAGGATTEPVAASAPAASGHPLVGRWTHSEGYASGGFSMATETVLRLSADGRYQWSSQVAGGDMDNGFDSGDAPETGTWSEADGELTLACDDGSSREYRWRLVDGTLVLESPNGRVRYFE